VRAQLGARLAGESRLEGEVLPGRHEHHEERLYRFADDDLLYLVPNDDSRRETGAACADTEGRGVDVAYNVGGGATSAPSVTALAVGARLATIVAAQEPAPTSFSRVQAQMRRLASRTSHTSRGRRPRAGAAGAAGLS